MPISFTYIFSLYCLILLMLISMYTNMHQGSSATRNLRNMTFSQRDRRQECAAMRARSPPLPACFEERHDDEGHDERHDERDMFIWKPISHFSFIVTLYKYIDIIDEYIIYPCLFMYMPIYFTYTFSLYCLFLLVLI